MAVIRLQRANNDDKDQSRFGPGGKNNEFGYDKMNISLTHLLRTVSVCVEINITSNNTYRIQFDLGNWGGKRISRYNKI